MDAAAHHRPSEVRRLVVHLVIRLSFLGRSLARGRFSHEVTRHRTMPREWAVSRPTSTTAGPNSCESASDVSMRVQW